MLIESLKGILKHTENLKYVKGKYIAELSDIYSGGKKYVFRILDVPKNTLIIRADKFPNVGSFLTDPNEIGICKKADYILISEKADNSLRVLVIEITKGNSKSKSDVIKQLKGATCILRYCEHIVKEFFNTDNIKKVPIHYVGILQADSAKKQRIDYTNDSTKNQKIENFFKITSGSECHYRKLVS